LVCGSVGGCHEQLPAGGGRREGRRGRGGQRRSSRRAGREAGRGGGDVENALDVAHTVGEAECVFFEFNGAVEPVGCVGCFEVSFARRGEAEKLCRRRGRSVACFFDHFVKLRALKVVREGVVSAAAKEARGSVRLVHACGGGPGVANGFYPRVGDWKREFLGFSEEAGPRYIVGRDAESGEGA
jgi:hypothetical protein